MDLTRDWNYIKKVARQRLRNNRTSWQINKYGDLETLGAAGELAARLYLGLSTRLHDSFDGGVDLYWRGRKVDVKTTRLCRLREKFLRVPIEKPINSDIILSVAVNTKSKTACILGFVFKSELLKAKINHTANQPCHEIPIRELRPSWELYALPQRNAASKTKKHSTAPGKGTKAVSTGGNMAVASRS